jgi:L-threonylcarbamoyladenylate synthase
MIIVKAIPSKAILEHSVFVYPTETCYGLGCDVENSELVERVYAIKGRNTRKQLSWIVADLGMAKRHAVFSRHCIALAKAHWPGPLTLVLPSRENGDIALRVSSHRTARRISKILQKPIIATSANSTGDLECYSIDDVVASLGSQTSLVDYIIDGGVLPHHKPTTIVSMIENKMKVLRQGEVEM